MLLESLNSYNLRNKERIKEDFKIFSDCKNLPVLFIVFLICLPFFAIHCNALFQLYNYEYGFAFTSLFITLTLLLCFIVSGFSFSQFEFGNLFFILIMICYSIFSAFYAKGGFRFVGVVINTMGTVLVISKCRINKRIIYIVFTFAIISCIYCMFGVKGYGELFLEGASRDYVNSNYVALMGLAALFYGNAFLCYIRTRENVKTQLLRLLLAVGSLYIIWECKSRGCLIGWLFYMACVYLVPVSVFRNKRIVTLLPTIITLVGITFSYVYITFLLRSLPAVLGKRINTRQRVWSAFWGNIFTSITNSLFGYGTHSKLRESLGYGFHCAYLDIWYNIGLIGLILIIIFITYTLRSIYKNDKQISIVQGYLIIGFLSFMVSDFFAATITGPLIIWNYALLGLARSGIDTVDNDGHGLTSVRM